MNSKQEDFKEKHTRRRRFVEQCNWRSVGYARWIAMAVIHSKKKIRPPV